LIIKTKNGQQIFVFGLQHPLSLGRFMLEFLRGDTPRDWLDLTAAQWTSMVVLGISTVLVGLIYHMD